MFLAQIHVLPRGARPAWLSHVLLPAPFSPKKPVCPPCLAYILAHTLAALSLRVEKSLEGTWPLSSGL